MRRDMKAKHIHNFRVSVKKIRAIANVLSKSEIPNEEVKAITLPLKKPFKAAGKVREPQVYKHVLAKKDISHEGLADLFDQHVENAEAELSNRLELFNADQWHIHSKRIVSKVKKLDPDTISKAAEKLAEEVITNIHYRLDEQPRDYHTLRKQFKILQEIDVSLPEALPDKDDIKQLTDLLGDWHDLFELEEEIKINQDMDKNTCEQIHDYRQAAENEADTMLNAVITGNLSGERN